ncbi:MAG: hypothetical protein MUD06_09860 [Rhodospirillales bacterium]|nr:hypothetical protein [Rhodospirillales bacterium]
MIARPLPASWLDFVAWCRARRLRPLPAHPWTLAAYARWCEPRHRYPTIMARVRAIARVHLLRCATSPDRHPTVVRTLAMIEARERASVSRSALFQFDDEPAARPSLADAAVGVRGNGAKAKEPAPGRRRTAARGLRLTPPLVSRRPKGEGPGGSGAIG